MVREADNVRAALAVLRGRRYVDSMLLMQRTEFVERAEVFVAQQCAPMTAD